MALSMMESAIKNRDAPNINKGIWKEDAITLVNNEYQRRQQDKQMFELQVRLNIAFIEGNQYLDMNNGAMDLYEIPRFSWWEQRNVYNQVGPIIDTRIARLSRIRPILKVRPSGSGEQEDARTAKISNQLLKNYHYDEEIQSKLSEIYAWLESGGTVLMKNIWNKNKGRLIAKMAIPDEQTGEEKEIEIYEGELDSIICNFFEVFPDSSFNQNIEDCRSMIHSRAYHVDFVDEEWGQKVEPEETTTMQLQKNMIGLGGIGYGTGGFHFGTGKLKDNALVKEYTEIPSKKYPQGRLIIVANKSLLVYEEKLPYPVGADGKLGLNFTKVDCIKRPGCFWGRTIAERLIPVQRAYNSLRNRKQEYLSRCAIGEWMVEENSVDPDVFEAEAGAPGAVHIYKRGFSKPEMVQNKPLPNTFESEESNLLQLFSQLSGVSELSRQSKADAGLKSGVALQIALDQDDTRLSTTAGNVEQFLIQNGKQWLRLYKNISKGMRLLRAVGKNNVVELMDWEASDIKSDDVIIEAGTALAESLAQRRQMVFDLLGTPLLTDPDTGKINKEMQSRIFEMIELGTWEDGDSDTELHIQKAERENRSLSQGNLTQPAIYDDHFIHVQRHNNFRLTVDYEEMVAQNPQIDMIIQQHVDMHLNFMRLGQQLMQGQMPIQAPQGAPGQEGPLA